MTEGREPSVFAIAMHVVFVRRLGELPLHRRHQAIVSEASAIRLGNNRHTALQHTCCMLYANTCHAVCKVNMGNGESRSIPCEALAELADASRAPSVISVGAPRPAHVERRYWHRVLPRHSVWTGHGTLCCGALFRATHMTRTDGFHPIEP